jgi:hypothetical protein
LIFRIDEGVIDAVSQPQEIAPLKLSDDDWANLKRVIAGLDLEKPDA